MNAKQFFYVCAGILLLVAAYTVGARNAKADFAPGFGHVTGSGISGQMTAIYYLRSDGTAWRFSGNTWDPAFVGFPGAYTPLPVPMSEILLWNVDQLITKGGEGWEYNVNNGWTPHGAIPPPAVAISPNSWTGVKESFRK